MQIPSPKFGRNKISDRLSNETITSILSGNHSLSHRKHPFFYGRSSILPKLNSLFGGDSDKNYTTSWLRFSRQSLDFGGLGSPRSGWGGLWATEQKGEAPLNPPWNPGHWGSNKFPWLKDHFILLNKCRGITKKNPLRKSTKGGLSSWEKPAACCSWYDQVSIWLGKPHNNSPIHLIFEAIFGVSCIKAILSKKIFKWKTITSRFFT